eukprot:g705.t1
MENFLLQFSDLTPIPQDDGPAPVCAIAYSSEFVAVMDIFRAVMKKNELSQRALELTEKAIKLNPANYTAWHYRRLCLFELNCDLNEELKYIDMVSAKGSKNYQLWYHRRCIVERLGDFTNELKVTSAQLEKDAKNYHAWTHRQWVMQHFDLWDGELKYVEKLINEDVRNNSAWNQRWNVVAAEAAKRKDNSKNELNNLIATAGTANFRQNVPLPRDIKVREIDFALQQIKRAISNEAPYAYLRGIVKAPASKESAAGKYSEFPIIRNFTIELLSDKAPPAVPARSDSKEEEEEEDLDSPPPEKCPAVLSLLLDIAKEEGKKEEVKRLCERLVVYDSIRARYWSYVASEYTARA